MSFLPRIARWTTLILLIGGHGIILTPGAAGAPAPTDSIRARGENGTADANRSPTVTFTPPGVVRARAETSLSAIGADPDGDPLDYRWDFGDGQVSSGTPTVIHSWQAGGTYTISCTALDGHGGSATKAVTVTIEDPLVNWTQRDVVPASTSLYGVTYAGGQFVAVGSGGTVLFSPDGISWARTTAVAEHTYRSVAYDGRRYVAVGGRNNLDGSGWKAAIATSADGGVWVDPLPSASHAELKAVAFGAGQWVAVGVGGLILTSTDGAIWTKVTANGQDLEAIGYAAGLFVAVGANGTVLCSTDAKWWTNRAVRSDYRFDGLAYANGRWIATNAVEVWSSTDGLNWTKNAVTGGPTQIGSVAFASQLGVLIAPAYTPRLFLSTDGLAWAGVTLPTGSVNAVAEGNGCVVAVGADGRLLQAGAPRQPAPAFAGSVRLAPSVSVGQPLTLATNTSGLRNVQLVVDGKVIGEGATADPTFSWTPLRLGRASVVLRASDPAGRSITTTQIVTVGFRDWKWQRPRVGCGNLRTVTYALGRWWAAGELGAFVSSANGTDWSTTKPPAENRIDYCGAATDGTRLVFVTRGDEYSSAPSYPTIWTTTNGSDWKGITVPGVTALAAVACGGGRWVAVGGASILDSLDGVTWTRRLAPHQTTSLKAVAFGGGRWVAVGTDGAIVTSTDLATWTVVKVAGLTEILTGVAFLNNRWVAVGYDGRTATSTDGTNWTIATTSSARELLAVGTWSDQYVAVGAGGKVYRSADGTNWSAVDHPRYQQLAALAGHDNRLVAVGDVGEIQTGDAPTALTAPDLSVRMDITGLIPEGDHVTVAAAGTDFSTLRDVPAAGRIDEGGAWSPGEFLVAEHADAYGIARGPLGYVLACAGGRIYASAVGRWWERGSTDTTRNLYAIARGGGTYVAVGDQGAVLTSETGGTWTSRMSGVMAPLWGVTHGAAGFVAVGNGGVAVSSPDGLTWTPHPTGVTATLNAVTWSADTGYVAVGNLGTVITSVDGIFWTARATPVSDHLAAVAATPFGLVVLTMWPSDRMLVSADGVTWAACAAPAMNLRVVAADDRTLWAGGWDGLLLTHPLPAGPLIEDAPLSATLADGQSVTFSVTARGTGPLTYQWQRNGAAIGGATRATLTLSTPGAADVGSYTVTVTDGLGRPATTNPAQLRPAFAPPSANGRLANLSVRSKLAAGQGLIVGFATSEAKSVLVRGVGPTLAGFGVADAYGDPRLDVCDPMGFVVQSNDDWNPSLAATFTRLGAFPLSAGGKDAAVLRTVRGAASAVLQGPGAGTVLVEVYDAGSGYEPRLLNVSARNRVGTGDGLLIAGFVVDAAEPVKLLIRGVGPTLARFGVSGALADPKLAVFDQGNRLVAANDNWCGTASEVAPLTDAFNAAGAFRLEVGTKDAALLVTLPAGLYSAQLSGGDGGTGEALIEVYQLP